MSTLGRNPYLSRIKPVYLVLGAVGVVLLTVGLIRGWAAAAWYGMPGVGQSQLFWGTILLLIAVVVYVADSITRAVLWQQQGQGAPGGDYVHDQRARVEAEATP